MQTEGMQCSPDETECPINMNALDKRLFSWIDWNFGMDNGTEAAQWARTYAYAIAGAPLNMTFDPQTKEFFFCFEIELAVQAATEIFASMRFNYPQGFTVSTSNNVNATVGGDVVSITAAPQANDGDDACVHISQRGRVRGDVRDRTHSTEAH
eukprot:327368-Prymnesium_polylepis.2